MRLKGSGRHVLGHAAAVELPRSPCGNPGVRALEERRQPGLSEAPDAVLPQAFKRQRVRDRGGIPPGQRADRF